MWGRNKKRKSAQKVAKFIKKAKKGRKKAEKCIKIYENFIESIEKSYLIVYNYIVNRICIVKLRRKLQ